MLDILNDDVLVYLFSLIKPQPSHFLIAKRIYQLRYDYLARHMNCIIKLSQREYKTQALLHYYQNNLRNDLGHYRKYILYFISNKNRQTTIYPCINSYHRKLVHQFCDAQGLLHETIIKGVKKVRACKQCQSPNINIECDDYEDYFYCRDCHDHYAGYLAYRRIGSTTVSQKMIKITKIK